jgi:hypothetical protein
MGLPILPSPTKPSLIAIVFYNLKAHPNGIDYTRSRTAMRLSEVPASFHALRLSRFGDYGKYPTYRVSFFLRTMRSGDLFV